MMRVRARRRYRRAEPIDLRHAYSLVILGVALTVPLVLLHNELGAVLFIDIGVIAFAIRGVDKRHPRHVCRAAVPLHCRHP